MPHRCSCRSASNRNGYSIEFCFFFSFRWAEHICRNDAMPANIRIRFYENVGTHLTKGKIAYFCRCWRCFCETTQSDIFFLLLLSSVPAAVSEFRLFLFCMTIAEGTTENRMVAKWFNKFLGFENWYKLTSSVCRVCKKQLLAMKIVHMPRTRNVRYRVRLSRLSVECIHWIENLITFDPFRWASLHRRAVSGPSNTNADH